MRPLYDILAVYRRRVHMIHHRKARWMHYIVLRIGREDLRFHVSKVAYDKLRAAGIKTVERPQSREGDHATPPDRNSL